jgi:hypothetical protein
MICHHLLLIPPAFLVRLVVAGAPGPLRPAYTPIWGNRPCCTCTPYPIPQSPKQLARCCASWLVGLFYLITWPSFLAWCVVGLGLGVIFQKPRLSDRSCCLLDPLPLKLLLICTLSACSCSLTEWHRAPDTKCLYLMASDQCFAVLLFLASPFV